MENYREIYQVLFYIDFNALNYVGIAGKAIEKCGCSNTI